MSTDVLNGFNTNLDVNRPNKGAEFNLQMQQNSD